MHRMNVSKHMCSDVFRSILSAMIATCHFRVIYLLSCVDTAQGRTAALENIASQGLNTNAWKMLFFSIFICKIFWKYISILPLRKYWVFGVVVSHKIWINYILVSGCNRKKVWKSSWGANILACHWMFVMVWLIWRTIASSWPIHHYFRIMKCFPHGSTVCVI